MHLLFNLLIYKYKILFLAAACKYSPKKMLSKVKTAIGVESMIKPHHDKDINNKIKKTPQITDISSGNIDDVIYGTTSAILVTLFAILAVIGVILKIKRQVQALTVTNRDRAMAMFELNEIERPRVTKTQSESCIPQTVAISSNVDNVLRPAASTHNDDTMDKATASASDDTMVKAVASANNDGDKDQSSIKDRLRSSTKQL